MLEGGLVDSKKHALKKKSGNKIAGVPLLRKKKKQKRKLTHIREDSKIMKKTQVTWMAFPLS